MITKWKTVGLSLSALVAGAAVVLLVGQPAGTTVIRGVVSGAWGPVTGAVVRVQAGAYFAVTDAQGRFELPVHEPGEGVHLTAWAPGYYVAGEEVALSHGADGVILRLEDHPTADNADYEFISPTLDMDNPVACGHCHRARDDTSMPLDEWLQDAHANAATNPRFLSLYDGTTLDGEAGAPTAYFFDSEIGVNVPVAPSLGQGGVGPGFRLDFPDQGGSCATCHAPIAALGAPYDADPNRASGVAREGVTCDFCHKVWNARLRADGLPDPGLPGVLSLEFLRPHEGEQVFIGPFDDTPGEDIFSPLQNQSEFCAACHFGAFWGVTMYNSFGEWLASPYSDPATGQTCQDCHMPNLGVTVFAQLPPGDPHFVPQRDPQTIFSHLMPGAVDGDLLAETAIVEVDASREGDELRVTIRVTNTGAGHHVPTDNPLRNMILLVNVTDADGQALALLDGPTIPAWGGVGDPHDGYYAGQPGVLYAKILADFYTGETPTYAYWRQTILISDNRLPALATDETDYRFALPTDDGPITVDARLILRRAFIELMDLKDWDTPDILMTHETVVAQ